MTDPMDRLSQDLLSHIFGFDPTFHEIYRSRVLPELRRKNMEFMAEIFFFFFWDRAEIASLVCEEKVFRMRTTTNQSYTVEYMHENERIIFRIHNLRTGSWYDECLG